MTLTNEEIVEQLIEQIDEIFIKQLEHITKYSPDSTQIENEEKDEILSPIENANNIKFLISIQYTQHQLSSFSEIITATPMSDNLSQQFGLVCSQSFVSSAFESFKLALDHDDSTSIEDRLKNFAKHMSNVKFSEKGILDAMGGQVDLVNRLQNILLAVSKFAEKELPEEILASA